MADLPTIENILDIKEIKPALQNAWNESFPSKEICCEQGGFIYANPENPCYDLQIVRAGAGRLIGQRMASGPSPEIDLSKPSGGQKNWILVANFHTHPLDVAYGGNQYPGRADHENASMRLVPGMVISRDGIVKYGKDRRTDRTNPETYPPPPNPRPTTWLEGKLIKNSRPQRASNQYVPTDHFAAFKEAELGIETIEDL